MGNYKESPKSTSAFKKLETSRLEAYPNTKNYKKEEKEPFTYIQYYCIIFTVTAVKDKYSKINIVSLSESK